MSETEAKSDASLDGEYIPITDGLKKKIIKEGYGEVPPKGSKVDVHYVGTLLDGSKFDSSRDRGTPFAFNLGQGEVIKGWDEGVATMKVGEVAELLCAPDYAYGASGSPPKIPPNSTLKFEVEIIGFTEPTDTPQKRIKVATDKKEEGNKLFKEGSFDKAKLAYEKGKELVQDMWSDEGEDETKAKELTVALGSNITMCALKLGDYSSAITEGKDVLKLDPQNIKTIWRLGQAYMHVGEYENGIETVQKGLEIAPDDQNLKAILAQIHKKQAEYQKKEKNMYGKMFGGI